MRDRDKRILESLRKFRCLSRDDIISLHFSNLKNAIQACNTVMKRLTRDQYVEVNTSTRPYLYFPSPSPIKKDSQKIKHFMAITKFYLETNQLRKTDVFDVEKKFDKGMCEPDIFMIWFNTAFFVEIQLSTYTQKMIDQKMERYYRYFLEGSWRDHGWQSKDHPVFPIVWMLTDIEYAVNYPIKVVQTSSVNDFYFTSFHKDKIII